MTEAVDPERATSAEQIELSVREAAATVAGGTVTPRDANSAGGRPRWSGWTCSSGTGCAAPTWPDGG